MTAAQSPELTLSRSRTLAIAVSTTCPRIQLSPWSSTTPTAWVLVAQSMPAYSSCFTWVLLGGTMGAPSVPGRRAGCSLRGGPNRVSLAPVLAPRPVGRRGSHAGPHRTSRRGGRPTGTEGSSGSLTPTTPSWRLLHEGWANEPADPVPGRRPPTRVGGAGRRPEQAVRGRPSDRHRSVADGGSGCARADGRGV